MVFTQRAALGMLFCTVTAVTAGTASAQSQTCTDGSAVWSTAMAATPNLTLAADHAGVTAGGITISSTVDEMPIAPTPSDENVQWCVDSNDPRCSPDPAGAPASHLAHAGDAARVAITLEISAAPLSTVKWRDHAQRCSALGIDASIERPPQAR